MSKNNTQTDRITELEIKLTQTQRIVDDLSDILAEQTQRLERAEKRIQMLLERAAEAEAEAASGVALGDSLPPHW